MIILKTIREIFCFLFKILSHERFLVFVFGPGDNVGKRFFINPALNEMHGGNTTVAFFPLGLGLQMALLPFKAMMIFIGDFTGSLGEVE